MKELIDDIRARKPIRIIVDNEDYGIYRFNFDKQRYEGFGYLTLPRLKEILQDKDKTIKVERSGLDE